MHPDWKYNFGEQFKEFVEDRHQVRYATLRDAFEALTPKDSQQIWQDMSQRLQVPSKQLHDYYHNTFSRQFYDDFKPFKEEVRLLAE